MKKTIYKKITVLLYLFFLLMGLGIFTNTVFAQTAQTGYQLLAPLPCPAGTPGCTTGQLTNVDPAAGFGNYLNLMIKIFIGICAVLAVVMIVMGGMEYMTSELISSKEQGKDRITHAILGLLIALGAYALLFTINPNLLKSDLNVPVATPTTTGSPSVVTGGTPQQSGTMGTCTYYADASRTKATKQSTEADCYDKTKTSYDGNKTSSALGWKSN